jgi:hypothetical protein
MLTADGVLSLLVCGVCYTHTPLNAQKHEINAPQYYYHFKHKRLLLWEGKHASRHTKI